MVPVFRTSKNAPTLTVAGVREPKVLVSEAALAALTESEMRTALKHELAHVRYYDNLKKLFFPFAAFPGMRALEGSWSEQAEFAADDAAVSSTEDALNLAAALIKVSRICPTQPAPPLTTGLLHSSTALSQRVQRLFSWRQVTAPKKWRLVYVLPPAVAACAAIAATYSAAITQLHAATEWLVR